MKVDILRHPTEEDWQRCKMLALNTVGKESTAPASDVWKHKILLSGHSPIRTLMFTIRFEAPYYVSTHLVRHKHGVEHYVTSQRNDRQDNYDREQAPQSAPVVHIMDVNAQELITIANKRLCTKADPKTRELLLEVTKKVLEYNPEFEPFLVPQCIARNGMCVEFKSCGRWQRR